MFYCSNSDYQVNVTAKIIKPNLKNTEIGMTYFTDKLYYFEVCFGETGSHVFVVYENGIQKHREILLVSGGGDLTIYPEE